MRVSDFIKDRYFQMRQRVTIGEKIPDMEINTYHQGMAMTTTVHRLFRGHKVLMLTVPGAFTPTCTKYYIPGFVSYLEEFKKFGINTVACLAPNSAAVLKAWSELVDPKGQILMIPDMYSDISLELGIAMEDPFFGVVPKRTVFLVEDLAVKMILEEPNFMHCVITGAASCYEKLNHNLQERAKTEKREPV